MGECQVRMGVKSMQTEVRNCGLLSQTSMLHLHGFNYKHIPHLNAFQCHGRLSTGVVAAKVQNNTNYGKMGRAYAVAKYIYGISHPCTHTQTHTHAVPCPPSALSQTPHLATQVPLTPPSLPTTSPTNSNSSSPATLATTHLKNTPLPECHPLQLLLPQAHLPRHTCSRCVVLAVTNKLLF